MKTVIITGANGNLGSAVTKKFLDEGYRVIATVISEQAKSEMMQHANLQTEVVDLSNEKESHAFVAAVINQYKTIDGALMLVGGFAMGSIQETNTEAIQKQLALNFETAYHVAQPVFSHMMENGNGRLVFIGARPALEPSQGKDMLAYGLSKSLLFKLADYINATAKGKNITATVVAPSTLDTPLNRKSMPDTDPAVWVKPEALADILEFIVSEKGGPIRESIIKVYNNA